MEKVLIIEDDKDYCMLVERALTQDGFDVRCAGTMLEGLRMLSDQKPDAVVLDLALPDSPTNESVQRVKRCTQSAIIVVLSGSADPDAEKDAIMKSASGFINKNKGLKYLGTEIRNAIRTFGKLQNMDSALSALKACNI